MYSGIANQTTHRMMCGISAPLNLSVYSDSFTNSVDTVGRRFSTEKAAFNRSNVSLLLRTRKRHHTRRHRGTTHPMQRHHT